MGFLLNERRVDVNTTLPYPPALARGPRHGGLEGPVGRNGCPQMTAVSGVWQAARRPVPTVGPDFHADQWSAHRACPRADHCCCSQASTASTRRWSSGSGRSVSLVKIVEMCVSIVFSLRTSSLLIARFDRP